MTYIDVSFSDGYATRSRILNINEKYSTSINKEKVEKYYSKYCRINKLKVFSITHLNDKQAKRYSVDSPVDIYSDNTDFYTQKALEYAEKYGIITYKVDGKYLIYNQNYNANEFKGKWTRKPHTMQRRVDLDTMAVESRKLDRVQKNGWDNV